MGCPIGSYPAQGIIYTYTAATRMLPKVATIIPDAIGAEETCGTVVVPSSSPFVIPSLPLGWGEGDATGVVSELGTTGVVSVVGGVRPQLSVGSMADNGSISVGHSFCKVS